MENFDRKHSGDLILDLGISSPSIRLRRRPEEGKGSGLFDCPISIRRDAVVSAYAVKPIKET